MNGIYFCKLFLESTFTFTNWNLNLQLTLHSRKITTTHSIALFCQKLKHCVCYRCNIIRKSDCVFKNKFPLTKLGSSDDKLAYCSGTHENLYSSQCWFPCGAVDGNQYPIIQAQLHAGGVQVELTGQNLSHSRYLLMPKFRLIFRRGTRSVSLILESGKQCVWLSTHKSGKQCEC